MARQALRRCHSGRATAPLRCNVFSDMRSCNRNGWPIVTLVCRTAWRPVSALVAAALAVTVLVAPAAADDDLAVTIRGVDDADFPRISVQFSVDEGGVPLTSVETGDITATDGGEPAGVLGVEPAPVEDVPLALVLVVDASASMGGEPLARAQELAAGMLEALAPGDARAVVTFGGGVDVVHGFADDPGDAIDALGQLTASGDTALYDAVAEGIALASDSSSSRAAVVLLSDGGGMGQVSSISREASLEQAAALDGVVHVIGTGAPFDMEYLETLAAAGGGSYQPATGVDDAGAFFAGIEDELRRDYVVQLESTAAHDDDPLVSLEITRDGAAGSASFEYAAQRPPPTVTPQTPTPAPTPTRAPEPEAADTGDSNGGIPGALFYVFPVLAAGIVFGGGAMLVVQRRRNAWRRQQDALAAREHFIERASTLEQRDDERMGD